MSALRGTATVVSRAAVAPATAATVGARRSMSLPGSSLIKPLVYKKYDIKRLQNEYLATKGFTWERGTKYDKIIASMMVGAVFLFTCRDIYGISNVATGKGKMDVV